MKARVGRRRFLATGTLTLAVARFAARAEAADRVPRELAAIGRAPVWLNSPPPTAEALRGRVVLVDFWTYTCIDWLRTLPYVRAWAKSIGQSLVVIGVQTPEGPFESDVDNVRRATGQWALPFPVAIANDYAIWLGFSNQYWPALLAGDWTIGPRAAALHQSSGRLEYRFHARDVHLVARSSRPERPVRFRLTIDGQPPGLAHGPDVDASGTGTVAEPRLYQLVRQAQPIVDRTLAIECLDPGVEALSFTFG